MSVNYTNIPENSIAFGKIGNALTSTANDHVVASASDIYDLILKGYQSEINSALTESTLDLSERLSGVTFMTNDEYIFAIVDANGILLFGIRNDGDVVYNTGMSDEVRERFKELEGVQIMSNDQYVYAIVDQLENLLFGIKTDGTVVVPVNEFDGKIEKAQKTANKAVALAEALKAFVDSEIIAIHEVIDNDVAELRAFDEAISAYTENISAVTNEISALTENLSGISDDTVERLHELDGFQIGETGDYLLGITDSEGYQLLKIDNSGKTFVGNGITVYGDKGGIDVMDVGSYVYAVVDSEDKLLFGVTTEGSAAINKSLAFADLGGKFEIIEDSHEWIYAIIDQDENVIFGITTEGECYIPKGLPEDAKKRFEELGMIQVFNNEGNIIYAVTDSNDNVLLGIDENGNAMVNGITGFVDAEAVESDTYIYAIYDRNKNMLFAILRDGTVWVNKFNVGSDGTTSSGNNGYIADMDDEEFIHIVTDREGKILFGIRVDGSTYIPIGMSEDTKQEFKNVKKNISSVENDIQDLYRKINDWSDAESLNLPIPRVCARVEITGEIPPSKYTERDGVLTYNDVDGNTFTKPIKWSRQGNISSGFDKPNFGIDLLVSNVPDDEGAYVEFPIKFGNWPAQDSFHLKAYYSDFWKIRSLGSYHHAEDIIQARDMWNQRPWDKYKYGAAQQTSGATGTAVKGGIGALDSDMRTGALGHPDGFPFMLYINGLPYGLYTWNLKKHKDNYMITKNSADGSEIFFGDMLYGFFTKSLYGYWNPSGNLYPSVASETGNARTIHAAKYGLSGSIDVIFDHSASNDNGVTLTVTNSAETSYTKEVYFNDSAVTTSNTWEDGDYMTVTYDGANDRFNAVKRFTKWTEDKAFASGDTCYDVDTFTFEVSGVSSEINMYRSFYSSKAMIYDSQLYPCNGIVNEETGEITVGSRDPYVNTFKPSAQWWRGFDIKYPKEKLAREYDGLDENGFKKFRYEMFNYDSPSDFAQNPIYEWSHELPDGQYEFWGSKGEVREGMTNLNGATLGDGTPIKENLLIRATTARKTVDDYGNSHILLSYLDNDACVKYFFEWGFMPDSTIATYENDYYSMSSTERKALRSKVRKEIFDEHHDVDYTIDYFIVSQDLCYYDSITHNTLYMMYDGKHLVPTVYDMDITMGMSSTYVNSFPGVTSSLSPLSYYLSYVWEFYPNEIKERYAKYRDCGAISKEAYKKVVYDMVESIGFDNYELESKYWSQPSYRGPVYWKMPAGSLQPIRNKSGVFKNWGYDESLNKALPTAPSWTSAETVNVSYPFTVETVGDITVYSGVTEGVAGATILSTAFNPSQTDKGTDADNTDQTVSATLMAPGVTIPSTMHIVISSGNITVTQETDASNTNWDGDPILAQHAPVTLTGTATNIEATSHAAGKKFSFTADLQLKSADESIIINTKMSCGVTGGGKLTPAQNSVSEGSTMSPGELVFSGATVLSATTDGSVTNVSGRTTLTGVNTAGINLNGSWTVYGTTNGENCELTVSARSGNVKFIEDLTLTGTVNSGTGTVKGAAGSGVTYLTGVTVNDGAHYYICQVQHTASDEFKPSNAYTCGNPVGGVYDSPRRTYEWLVARMGYLDRIFGYVEKDISNIALKNEIDAIASDITKYDTQITEILERLGGENEGIQILYNTSDYLYAIVDTEGKLLFAIQADGSTYIAKGIPEDVQAAIDDINSRLA